MNDLPKEYTWFCYFVSTHEWIGSLYS